MTTPLRRNTPLHYQASLTEPAPRPGPNRHPRLAPMAPTAPTGARLARRAGRHRARPACCSRPLALPSPVLFGSLAGGCCTPSPPARSSSCRRSPSGSARASSAPSIGALVQLPDPGPDRRRLALGRCWSPSARWPSAWPPDGCSPCTGTSPPPPARSPWSPAAPPASSRWPATWAPTTAWSPSCSTSACCWCCSRCRWSPRSSSTRPAVPGAVDRARPGGCRTSRSSCSRSAAACSCQRLVTAPAAALLGPMLVAVALSRRAACWAQVTVPDRARAARLRPHRGPGRSALHPRQPAQHRLACCRCHRL